MSILVTGVPGWLGTELVRRLDRTEEDVRCFVLEGMDTSELEPYDVEITYGDIRDRDSLHNAFDDTVKMVYHCAGIIHPSKLFGADLFYDINANGTENTLEVAKEYNIDHFVYISSNAAQGFNNSPQELMTEDMPCRPESDYGKSKYEAEQHVRRSHREHDLDYTIIRPCWYYGPRQPERMTRLMNMIKQGNPLIFGNGKNLRSMTYVPALVDALLKVKEKPKISKNETYWIADEMPYTTDYIYRTIARAMGLEESLKPIYVPTPISRLMEAVDVTLGHLGIYEQNVHVAGEMSRHIACDPSKAEAELGYEPPSDLYSGMKKSVKWASKNGQI